MYVHAFLGCSAQRLSTAVQCCDDPQICNESLVLLACHDPDSQLLSAQLVPEGFESGAVYTGALRILIYVYFPLPAAVADDLQKYRCG